MRNRLMFWVVALAFVLTVVPAFAQQRGGQRPDARAFAFGEYLQALSKGNTLDDTARAAMADKLARYTGLSAKFLLASNLRGDASALAKSPTPPDSV
jgi:hypothetical protein